MLPLERAELLWTFPAVLFLLCFSLMVSVLGEVIEGIEVSSRCGAALKEVWGPLQTLVLVWRVQSQLHH